MSDFEIVPNEEFPEGELRGAPGSAISQALGEGNVLFVPESDALNSRRLSTLSSPGSYLYRRGLKVSRRVAVRNGVRGWYVRAIPREDAL